MLTAWRPRAPIACFLLIDLPGLFGDSASSQGLGTDEQHLLGEGKGDGDQI